MKNDKHKLSSSDMETGHDDEIIGAALSRGLACPAMPGNGQCPGPGEIAEVVEGIAPAGERDLVLAHVSACADCYELFLLTVELHKDVHAVEKESADKEIAEKEIVEREIVEREIVEMMASKAHRRKIIFFKPLALAASILIMVFSIYLFFRSGEIPKTPGELLEKSSALQESQAAPPAHPVEMPSRAKVKMPPGGDASTQRPPVMRAKPGPVGPETVESTSTAKASPEPLPAPPGEQEEVKEVAAGSLKLGATSESAQGGALPSVVPSPPAKTERREADDEMGSPPADADTGKQEAAKDIPLQQQAVLLNQQVQGINNYISPKELGELFNNALKLARQMGKEFETHRNEAVKGRDFNQLDLYANGLNPLIQVKTVGDKVYILPDVEWFFSRSEPGSVEYRFFSLARSGWCVAGDICTTGKIGRSEAQKLLAQWQTLAPQLTGTFKQVAAYTIAGLSR